MMQMRRASRQHSGREVRGQCKAALSAPCSRFRLVEIRIVSVGAEKSDCLRGLSPMIQLDGPVK